MRQYDDDSGPGNIALMRSLIAEGKPDPTLARSALATFCRRVRENRINGDRDSRDLLAWMQESISAFLENADKPDGLENALHLRGRAPDRERHERVGFQIEELAFRGVPIEDNREGDGAISIVAANNCLSYGAVKKIYYESLSRDDRADIRRMVDWMAGHQRLKPIREAIAKQPPTLAPLTAVR